MKVRMTDANIKPTSTHLVAVPDWSKWSKKKHIKLSEAILLANNICPNSHRWDDVSGLGEQLAVKKWSLVEICQDWLRCNNNSWVVKQGFNTVDFDAIEVDWPLFKEWLRSEIDWEVLELKPWEVIDPRDPPTKDLHIIATRYFARLERQANPSLTQEDLAKKAVPRLVEVGIFKRGGVAPYEYTSLLKALHKVIMP